MAANALQSALAADNTRGDGAGPAPATTHSSTDEAVQASLSRLQRLMESAREQVIAAARLEVASEGHVSGGESPALSHATEVSDSSNVARAPEPPAPITVAPQPSTGYVDDRVAEVTAEMEARLRAAFDSRLDELSGGLAETQARIDAAEMRSLDAIEDLGRRLRETSQWASDAKAAEARGEEAVAGLSAEVARISEALGAGLERLEGGQAGALEALGTDLARISESVEARLDQSAADQARALAGLDEKLERVSERLAERIGGADWRSSQANDEMGERLARACERLSRDLIERVEVGEERLVAMIVQTREDRAHEDVTPAETASVVHETAPAEALAETPAAPACADAPEDDLAAPVAAVEAHPAAGDTQPEIPAGFLSGFSPHADEPAPTSVPESDATTAPPVEFHHDWSLPAGASHPADGSSPPGSAQTPAKTGFWRRLF